MSFDNFKSWCCFNLYNAFIVSSVLRVFKMFYMFCNTCLFVFRCALKWLQILRNLFLNVEGFYMFSKVFKTLYEFRKVFSRHNSLPLGPPVNDTFFFWTHASTSLVAVTLKLASTKQMPTGSPDAYIRGWLCPLTSRWHLVGTSRRQHFFSLLTRRRHALSLRWCVCQKQKLSMARWPPVRTSRRTFYSQHTRQPHAPSWRWRVR